MLKTMQIERLTPESHETLLTILETLPGALFVLDDASTIIYANTSVQTLTGAAPETLVGNSFWRCAPQVVSTALYQAIQQTKQTRALAEVRYVSPVTGSWLHVHLSPTSGGLTLQFHEMEAPAHTQEMVLQRESLYMDVLDHVHAGILFLTPEGIVLDLNEVPLDDAQIRREEVVGKPLVEGPWWSSSPDRQHLSAAIARASHGETVHFEALVHPRKGMDLFLEVTILPQRDAEHHIAYLVVAGIDITARKHAEAELHALIDAIPQLVWIARPDGYVTYHNQRLIDYLAMTQEQAEGTGWLAGVHPDDRQRVWQAWQSSIQTGGPYGVEVRLQDGTSGAYRWFLVRGVPQRNAQGSIPYWVGTCTDIEDQKRVEQRLKESEQNWRVLTETVPQLVWTTQPDGSVTYWNQRSYDYLSLTAEQIQNDKWAYLPFLHPDDQEGHQAHWQHALDTGDMFEHEQRLKHGQTGEYRWFLTRALPMRDETDQIVKWFGTCTDIEEQKQAEQQLKESRESLRVLAETVPQMVWVVGSDGLQQYMNQRGGDYTGLSLEQLQSDRWTFLQAVHPDDQERIRVHWQHALETGEMLEYEGRLKHGQTGEYRWFLVRALPMCNETGQLVKWFGTCTDIDERKRLEEALRQSQERASVLMNSSIIGISVLEEELIVDANDTFLRMTGYTREDLRAGRMNVLQMTAPDYLARTLEAHQKLAAQQVMTPYEKEYLCKDGSRLPVVVGGVVLQRHPLQGIAFVLDNSARQELEQRKDAFISMASHELRNPLTALKLQTTLLHRQLAGKGMLDQAPALSRMETQIKTITRLVEELLDVSKIQAGKLEYVQERVDLDAVLREITDTLQQSHPSHTLVVRSTVGTSLIGDRDRLGQVFTNLITNAIKYAPGTETVEIDLSTSEDVISVQVRDHGLGIPREQRDKIFERFYRVTDPKQRAIAGLGMGLYIVAEIVKHHGGTITVDSAIGKGSTFTVTLPTRREV